jgi:hypothetical protein
MKAQQEAFQATLLGLSAQAPSGPLKRKKALSIGEKQLAASLPDEHERPSKRSDAQPLSQPPPQAAQEGAASQPSGSPSSAQC